jgi:hypothetical protein
MAVYRFRVAFEDYDDVVRDIEIRSTQTFEDLHRAIQQYIGFDGSKPSSFYMSDDNWKKGKEITNRAVGESEKVWPMSAAKLINFIVDPHQKIYYVFDLPNHWTFHIELVKISINPEDGTQYPRCIKTLGEAPKQYGNIVAGPLPQPEDFDEMLLDETDEEEEEQESDFVQPAEGVDAEDVPLGVVSEEESSVEDVTGESNEIVDEDEPREGEEY